jgi:hypothetical protein
VDFLVSENMKFQIPLLSILLSILLTKKSDFPRYETRKREGNFGNNLLYWTKRVIIIVVTGG